MSWKDVEMARGGKDFLSIKDGESKDVVIRGEPYCFYQIFKDNKEYQTKVPDSSFKFKIAVVTKEEGSYVGKILSGGYFLAASIKENIDENGQDAIYKIKRTGTGKDTKYFVLFKGKLTPEQMEAINSVAVPLVGSYGNSRTEEQHDEQDDIPF